MLRKISIATLYKNTNYGANIQAFVLNKYINDKGYDCCLLLWRLYDTPT